MQLWKPPSKFKRIWRTLEYFRAFSANWLCNHHAAAVLNRRFSAQSVERQSNRINSQLRAPASSYPHTICRYILPMKRRPLTYDGTLFSPSWQIFLLLFPPDEPKIFHLPNTNAPRRGMRHLCLCTERCFLLVVVFFFPLFTHIYCSPCFVITQQNENGKKRRKMWKVFLPSIQSPSRPRAPRYSFLL